MARTPAVIALDLNVEPFRLGESKQLPFAKVGEWDFPEDYGDFHVTPDHLDAIERHFRADVRRVEVPLLNEEHGPGAVGWITDFVRVAPDRLDAIVELNSRGEQALEGDEYRRVSPEILRDYFDAETGESYSMVAAGLALTTAPRLKALDRIAASEHPRILAFAEAPGELTTVGSHIDGSMGNTSVAYGFPELQRLPINTKAQVKGSVARFAKVKNGDGTPLTETQRTAAWEKIAAAAKRFGIDVPSRYSELRLSALETTQYLMAEAVKHTHAKRGGGKMTHEHDDATKGHSHNGMLPAFHMAEGDAGESGDGDGDFDDQPCPSCGNDDMDVISMDLRCPACGTHASFNASAPLDRFAEISGKQRDALDAGAFAVPGKRQLPIQDAAHVRAALARFSQTQGLTPEEKATAKTKIQAAAKKFGIQIADGFHEIAGATLRPGFNDAVPDEEKGVQTPPAETAAATTATAPTPEPAAAAQAEPAAQGPADFSELKTMHMAEVTENKALRAQVQELSENMARQQTAQKMAVVAERIDGLVREGKVTPAEAETFKESARLVKLSEDSWPLDVFTARKPVVEMRERGASGIGAEAVDDGTRLAEAAKVLMSEKAKGGTKISMKEAILEVARLGYRG